MTKLFYHKADAISQGARVTAHMFGTASDPRDGVRHFTPDPTIANCSTSLRALQAQHGLDLPADELLAIQADTPEVERVLKAVLANQLRTQWNRGYEAILGNGVPDTIPGFGTVSASALRSALTLERQTANDGIDAIMESLEVSPVWLEVEVMGVPATWNLFRDRWQLLDMPTMAEQAGQEAIAPLFHNCTPRIEGEMPADTTQSPAGETPRNGYFNTVLSLPFYLPKRRSMLGLGSARELSDADRLQVARGAFESLAKNPEMLRELMQSAHLMQMQYVQPLPAITQVMNGAAEQDDAYDDEDDDDLNEENPWTERPHG